MFQKTIISKYLKTQNKETLLTQWNLFAAHFHNTALQENIRNAKEEQYQEGFLRDLFVQVLGYTLNPAAGFNLTTEYKNIKDSKKADGAIIIDDKVVGVIELKGTNITDLGKIEEQAFNYKNNQTACTYVVTANFEKLRLYIDDSVRFTEFHLFNLKQEDFNLLYLLLAFENIKNNIAKKIKDESLNQEDIVTKKLYKDYSVFKRELFQNLTLLNPAHDPLELFQKSQKLLDRILFLLFGEDRGLLPPNSVRQILEQWVKLKDLDEYVPLYNRYKKYFGYLNTGFKGKTHDVFAYNGGLFKDDEILDEIKIDDDILYQHTFHLSQYDFASEVDVNILGHIFENSLNEIDEIKAQLAGEVIDRSKTKRKKDGVFYTPKYITKYIVENTVGKLCGEKKNEYQIVEEEYFTDKKRQQKTRENLLAKLDDYRSWLLQITIVDPACGSGAFLNEALNFLIEEHKFIDELEAKLLNVPIIFRYHSESILENNLFGVDLNEESVEIAKLSLWLRTAEPNRKLNSLNDNIKCGNSLIDDPAIAGDKAFNWVKEFPQVFEKGGFDVVIGNPPYVVRNLPIEIKTYLNQKFESAQYQLELYVAFIEKSIKILNENGCLSLITPNSWLKNMMMSNLRKFILEHTYMDFISLDLKNIFDLASVDTLIFKLSLKKKSESIQILKQNDTHFELSHFINQNDFDNNNDCVFNINVTKDVKNILDKLDSEGIILENYFDVTRGVNPYDKYTGQSDEIIKSRSYHSPFKKDETFVPELKGLHLGRYFYSWDNKHFISYGKWLAAPRESKYFEGGRIIFREILGKTLITTYIEEEFIIDRSLYIAKPKEESDVNIKYVLSLLNSRLYIYYFKYKKNEFDQLFPKIRVKEFKGLPIKNIISKSQLPFIEKADCMLFLNKELQEVSGKFQRNLEREFSLETLSQKLQSWYQLSYDDFLKELKKQKVILSLSQKAEWEHYFNEEKNKAEQIQSQISSTDKEIDKMVYALYGLTEEEIGIVEKG